MTTPPSTLVLLSELPNLETGAKVRFAGRVASYDIEAGYLTLTSENSRERGEVNAQNTAEKETQVQTRAHVEISHVLHLAQSSPSLFEEESVVDVIGYITQAPSLPPSTSSSASEAKHRYVRSLGRGRKAPARTRSAGAVATTRTYEHVFVQAVMLWDAPGTFGKSGESGDGYEEGVLARRRAMQVMAAAARGRPI